MIWRESSTHWITVSRSPTRSSATRHLLFPTHHPPSSQHARTLSAVAGDWPQHPSEARFASPTSMPAGGVRTRDLRIKSHTNPGLVGCAGVARVRWIRLACPHIWAVRDKTRGGRARPIREPMVRQGTYGFFAPSHDLAELPRRHPRRVRLPDRAESRTERDSAGLATIGKPPSIIAALLLPSIRPLGVSSDLANAGARLLGRALVRRR